MLILTHSSRIKTFVVFSFKFHLIYKRFLRPTPYLYSSPHRKTEQRLEIKRFPKAVGEFAQNFWEQVGYEKWVMGTHSLIRCGGLGGWDVTFTPIAWDSLFFVGKKLMRPIFWWLRHIEIDDSAIWAQYHIEWFFGLTRVAWEKPTQRDYLKVFFNSAAVS